MFFTSIRARSALPLALLALAACKSSGTANTTPAVDPYAYQAPPTSAPPAGLDAATWLSHETNDLLPYWTMSEAQGVPVGNFPTNRGMDGSIQGPSSRKPRMMGRQVFAYSVAYMLTGEESLLDLARAGNQWLLAHAVDSTVGGWHSDLDASGNPLTTGDTNKYTQDMAYDAMGPAAFFFVTADPDAEAAVLKTRDLLFDPTKFWDAANGRIKDGMDSTLSTEVSLGSSAGVDIVSELDPITGFLLLVQPVLTDSARRDQVLSDVRTLALRLQASFWAGGIFWGSTGVVGQYMPSPAHTDFGHILKAYWGLLQVDKRLPDHPLQSFLLQHAPATLTLAYDAPNGRWAKFPTSTTTVAYGSDWWAFAEADNLAATLALHDSRWIATLGQTATNFRGDYVDRTRPAREVVSSVSRTGSWVYPWPDADTSKCNVWKNGFHTAEHALVLYLFANWLAGTPAPLYFAFPAADVATRAAAARPYTFLGNVVKVEDLGPLAGDPTRHKVRVSFDQLR